MTVKGLTTYYILTEGPISKMTVIEAIVKMQGSKSERCERYFNYRVTSNTVESE